MAQFTTVTGEQIELTRETVDRVIDAGAHTKLYYDDNRKKAVVAMPIAEVEALLDGTEPPAAETTEEPPTEGEGTTGLFERVEEAESSPDAPSDEPESDEESQPTEV